MASLSRRRFLKTLVASGAMSLDACQSLLKQSANAHVVVVGGGFGGATAAKMLRLLDSNIKVTLIEPKVKYITCPGSNWLFAGLTDLDRLTVDYRNLSDRYGVNVICDSVATIDRELRRLRLAIGSWISYDRLILAPGIEFIWDTIEGYSSRVAELFPHAWQAGPQTSLLLRQLIGMRDGGTVLITAPAEPYRCPPGPYERASLMAYWLSRHNPRAKILILDAKRSFSKQTLFEAGWAKHYGYGTDDSLIEWHSLADNPIIRLDQGHKTVITEFGDRFSGDVLNIIPPQKAARIASLVGLTDQNGWCQVLPQTGQALFDQFIHVIGDAAHYAPIPKSAFAANSEAKACAIAVAALLNDNEVAEPNWLNTCYSLVTPSHGISVAGVYKLDSDKRLEAVKGAGGVSSPALGESAAREAGFALSAYRALVNDTFV